MTGKIDLPSERKRQELELQRTHERLRLAQRAAQAGIWDWDVASGEIVWSEELYRLFGLDPARDEASFEAWRRVLHPEDRVAAEQRIADAVREHLPLSSEYRILLPSGETRWIVSYGDTAYDAAGQPLRMAGICVDIGRRKRMEVQLAQNTALLESIFKGIPDPILYADRDRNVVAVNAAFTAAFQYTLDEIRGWNGVRLYKDAQEYERLGRLRFHADAPEQGRPYEAEYRRKDGSIFHGETVGTVIRNAGGEVQGYLGVIRDITERRRQEAVLRQSEDRYRALAEWSPEPIMVHRDRKVIYANPAAVAMFGATAVSALVGKDVLELVHPDYHASWLERLRNVMERGMDAPMMERKLLGLDGRIIHAEVSGTSFEFDGAPAVYLAIRDVSRQLQAANELAYEKALFEAIFNGIADAIVYADLNRNIVAINPGFTSVFGYTMADLAGHTTSFFYESMEEYERQGRIRFNLNASDKALPYEVNYRSKEGRVFPGETLGTAIKGKQGEILGYIGVIRDISGRKAAANALRESTERLSAIFDVANVGISITDALGKHVLCNNWWTEMLGYSNEELRQLSNIDVTHPEDRDESLRRFREVLEDRSERYRLEKRFVRKDGSVFWGDLSVSAIKDSNKRVINIVGMVTDVTERKRAEAARAQFEMQLRESQKMEALGTLAGGVAHDFNNALATILGNVELARQDVGTESPALESLEEIAKAGRRAKDLVQQILAFGRRQTVARKIVSLAPAVQEAARLLRATLPAGVRLQVDCAPDAPVVLADATQIEQVVLNLGSNAWHALRGEARAGEIEIRVAPAMRDGARLAALTVRDNGRGMDDAIRARIFDPFFTTKGVGEGTGLGLSVVHGIACEHGASIEVESTPGAGTRIGIFFPAAEEQSVQRPEQQDRAQDAAARDGLVLQGEGKHILYIDDDEAIVFLMKRMLERQGYRVSAFTNPHEALVVARASSQAFDLAVTDYNMPGMSGLEVASALREIAADLPVVLASGYITEELTRQAPQCGVRELLYKPNSADELCQAIARYAGGEREVQGSARDS